MNDNEGPLLVAGQSGDASWAKPIALVAFCWAVALLAAWVVTQGEAKGSNTPRPAYATLVALDKGSGFVVVPLSDADAYALEGSIGATILILPQE